MCCNEYTCRECGKKFNQKSFISGNDILSCPICESVNIEAPVQEDNISPYGSAFNSSCGGSCSGGCSKSSCSSCDCDK